MSMDWAEFIMIDPAVRGGQPVVRGTRVPVEKVLGALAAGDSLEDVCREYMLSPEQVRGCLAFAAAEIGEATYRALPHR